MNRQGKVWGNTSLLFVKNNVELHFIQAIKGGYCSKHCHKTKYNKFIVLSGKLKISIWKDYKNSHGHSNILEDITFISDGEECTVNPGDYHRFEAMEDTNALELYWVDLLENDIIRSDCGGMSERARVENEKKANECLSRNINIERESECGCPLRAKSE